jgi:nitrogenase molybdenum-iron protein alpha/beta subunit
VKLLLDHGASVFAEDIDGKSALDYARTDEIKEILKDSAEKASLFEKVGAKVNNYLKLDFYKDLIINIFTH